MAERRRGPGRRRIRATAVAAAALAAALIAVAPASGAEVIYPSSPTAVFGPDGTSATTFDVGLNLAFNQSSQRLYATAATDATGGLYKIYGYDVSALGTYAPLGPADGFPIDLGSPEYPGSNGVTTDGPSGNVYYASTGSGLLAGFSSSGAALPGFPVGGFEGPCGVATDGQGNVWVADEKAGKVDEFNSSGDALGSLDVSVLPGSPCEIAIDAANDDLYVVAGSEIFKYEHGPDGYTTAATLFAKVPGFSISAIAVDPGTHNVFAGSGSVLEYSSDGSLVDTFAQGVGGGGPRGIAVDSTSHVAYIITAYSVEAYGPVVTADADTTTPTNVTPTSATLTGHVDPLSAGDITDCHFEWGPSGIAGYPNQVPCTPAAPFSSPTDVSAGISGLNPGTGYHYRVVATDANGTTPGGGVGFQTLDKPTVDSLYTSDLSATTATLHAAINPQGADTTYHFEYGTTLEYGTSIPIPDEDIGSSYSDQEIAAQLTGLQQGSVYHFRIVATNSVGTTTSRDQTFNYFPPPCPNAQIRQETGSQYLPDCRAYELVSPEDAGNVVLFDYGVPSPYASNPARFMFGGALGGVRGTNPVNGFLTDTYVATRSSTGWHTSYVGIPGNEVNGAATEAGSLDMSRFLSVTAISIPGVHQPPDNLPHFYNAEGESLGIWPGDWSIIPGAKASVGDYQPSPDFSHLAISSNNVALAPNGLTTPPGSAYDYDVETGTTTLISLTPGGHNIPQEPTAAGSFPEEFILFPDTSPNPTGATAIDPGVSTDGSHILMATMSESMGGFLFPPLKPQHLYMRVKDAVTYDVSKGHDVNYVGMTSDGTKVFFTSPERLTADDTDNSTDLYMWSEEGDKLTLLSKGSGGAGNGDDCNASWTSGCGVVPVEGLANTDGSLSSYLSDTDYPIATEAGDIYFYSPEQLDGSKGLPGAQNLYVYREGAAHFVTLFPSPAPKTCSPQDSVACSNGPIGRIEVTPDGDHMAFTTASRISSYDNAGFQEMYTYDPASGKILCVSCMPDGSRPTVDVRGSYTGLFMTNDGRTFFATSDALVPQDTDEASDVYEFVDGRPQLITSGTATQDTSRGGNLRTGLDGVSADGVDVYFSTYDSLVPNDHNGPYRKFYDARTGGGFSFEQPPTPCDAADECHGAGSPEGETPSVLSDAQLGSGGNFSAHKSKNGRRHSGKKHQKRNHSGKKAGRRHGRPHAHRHSRKGGRSHG